MRREKFMGTVGIVAPSAKVPQVELALGVEKLRGAGYRVKVHPQAKRSHLFFAGTDEERAQALVEFALDPEVEILWCARGGHGALRILPILDRLSKARKIPAGKLLAGYSDATALMEYVRTRWNWSALHAPMPGAPNFLNQTQDEWTHLLSLLETGAFVGGKKAVAKLRFSGASPSKSIEGELVGGNLTVWTALLGTAYAPDVRGKILFFEDVGEALYRLDRMLCQLELSGGLKGARAWVLGNFDKCDDSPPRVLARKPLPEDQERCLRAPRAEELHPLRAQLDPKTVIPKIFQEFANRTGARVAYGLPVGHGPGYASLPLGARYRLTPDGKLELRRWGWKGVAQSR